jgi:hypothetical protein
MTRQMFMRLISAFRGEERSFDYGPHTGARYDVCGGPFPADRCKGRRAQCLLHNDHHCSWACLPPCCRMFTHGFLTPEEVAEASSPADLSVSVKETPVALSAAH